MGVPWISLLELEQMLLPEQNPEQRPYDLLQQRHPLRVYVPAAADYAVHVGAAGHTCTAGVSARITRRLPGFCLSVSLFSVQ